MTDELDPASTTETPPAGGSGDPLAGESERTTVSIETHRKVQNEAKNLRERLRALEAAEAERKQAEMSDAERLAARLEAAEKRARELEVQAVRTKAANAHKLPGELWEFVTAEEEAGAMAQAEKLAAQVKPKTDLPSSGGRNPAHGGEQAARRDEQERFDRLRRSVPALNNRVIRD